MKLLIIVILIFTMSSAFSQKLEFSGGISHNTFYDTDGIKSNDTRSTYEGGLGHAARLGVAFDLPNINTPVPFSLKFSVGYSAYMAGYKVEVLNVPARIVRTVDVQKTTLDLGFYPINVWLMNRLGISMGGELNLRLKGDLQVPQSLLASFRCPPGGFCTSSGSFRHRNVTFRLTNQFSYLIPLTPKLALVPQYQFSIGLLEEFYGNRVNTKTAHNTFRIGIRKEL